MSQPLSNEFLAELKKRLLTLQIIVGALMVGCATFLILTVVFRFVDAAEADDGGLVITYVAFAAFVPELMALVIAPNAVVKASRKRIIAGTWQDGPTRGATGAQNAEFIARHGDAARLWAVYMVRTIVAAAILEGAAFFFGVAFLLEHSAAAAIAAVVLILAVAAHFPTLGRVSGWIEDQLRRVEDERMLGGG